MDSRISKLILCILQAWLTRRTTRTIDSARADDLLRCGTSSFYEEAVMEIRTFLTGDVAAISRDSPIIFAGFLIERPQGDSVLSQQMDADALPTMGISGYLPSTEAIQPKLPRSTCKQRMRSRFGYAEISHISDSILLKSQPKFRERANHLEKPIG